MGANSRIEWCDATFNSWIGCERISPACDHCYAANSTATRSTQARTGKQLWNGDRYRTSASNWAQPLAWDRAAAKAGKRIRVFCASLADVFDNAVPPEWRQDLGDLIQNTPNLDWLLLTKRIGNAGKMLGAMFLDGTPDNIWVGATVVTQEEVDRDIPKLLATPAAKRFLSIEPMLGPIELSNVTRRADCVSQLGKPAIAGIDWMIVGGESGPGARPMHPQWVRSIRDQCTAAGVAFLFKQWGEWLPGCQPEAAAFNGDGCSIHEWNDAAASFSIHLPKKHAGRVLDGRTHDEFPA
jgi:protein gp37